MAVRKPTKVELLNVDNVRQFFKTYTDEVKREVKIELATTARSEVESPAKEMVPVVTGNLKSRIATYDTTDLNDFSVTVEARVDYAQKIHRTGGRGGKGKGFLDIPLQQAKPGLMARLKQIMKG